MFWFLHSSGASNQADRFSHLGGSGARRSGGGDRGRVSIHTVSSHMDPVRHGNAFCDNLNNVVCAFQPHVHGDERSAEDERQYCYECHAWKFSR